MASCNICQLDGLSWSENVNSQGKHYLFSETGPHVCKPQVKQQPKAIPLYVQQDNGVMYRRKDDNIARDITNEEMRCGIKPGRGRLERKGDWIYIH